MCRVVTGGLRLDGAWKLDGRVWMTSCAAQPAQLDEHLRDTASERGDHGGQLCSTLAPVGVAVGADQLLVDAPGRFDFDVVFDREQRRESLLLPVGEQVGADVQHPASQVQRIVLPAPPTVEAALDPATALIEGITGQVRSTRGAVPVSRPVRFPGPPPEPDVRLSPHPALHEVVPMVIRVLARPMVTRCCPDSGSG